MLTTMTNNYYYKWPCNPVSGQLQLLGRQFNVRGWSTRDWSTRDWPLRLYYNGKKQPSI
jgi:predicted secreted hydrolase